MKKYLSILAMTLVFMPVTATELMTFAADSDLSGTMKFYEIQNIQTEPIASTDLITGSGTSYSDLLTLATLAEQNNELVSDIRNEIANLRELLMNTKDPVMRDLYLLRIEEYEEELFLLTSGDAFNYSFQEVIAQAIANARNLFDTLSNIMKSLRDLVQATVRNLL